MVQPERLAARAERVGGRSGRARPVAPRPGPHGHRRPRSGRLRTARTGWPPGWSTPRRPGWPGMLRVAARRAGRRGLARSAARAARRPAPADRRPTAGSTGCRRTWRRPSASRVGYPVRKADVLAGPGLPDHWYAVGAVDSVELPAGDPPGLAVRRDHAGAGPLLLSFAPPGGFLDDSVTAGQRLHADAALLPGLRAVPGPGRRAARRGRAGSSARARDVRGRCWTGSPRCWPPTPGPPGCRRWCGPQPIPPRPERRTVAAAGGQRRCAGTWSTCPASRGRCWPARWASRSPIFGEWAPAGFRPLSLLPDGHGASFSADGRRTGGVSAMTGPLGGPGDHRAAGHRSRPVPDACRPERAAADRRRPDAGSCSAGPPGTGPRSGPASAGSCQPPGAGRAGRTLGAGARRRPSSRSADALAARDCRPGQRMADRAGEQERRLAAEHWIAAADPGRAGDRGWIGRGWRPALGRARGLVRRPQPAVGPAGRGAAQPAERSGVRMNALAPDQRTEPLRPHAEQAFAAELAALAGRRRPATPAALAAVAVGGGHLPDGRHAGRTAR